MFSQREFPAAAVDAANDAIETDGDSRGSVLQSGGTRIPRTFPGRRAACGNSW